MAVPVDRRGTVSMEAVKVLLVPGVQKTSSLGRKMDLGLSSGGAGEEGEETIGSENETRFVTVGPPG